jgi:hypothetical protein
VAVYRQANESGQKVKPVKNRVDEKKNDQKELIEECCGRSVESSTEVQKDESRYFIAVDRADRVVMDRQHSSFRGVERPVSRLFKREQTVDSSVVSEALGDNRFDDLRDERQVRDWT